MGRFGVTRDAVAAALSPSFIAKGRFPREAAFFLVPFVHGLPSLNRNETVPFVYIRSKLHRAIRV